MHSQQSKEVSSSTDQVGDDLLASRDLVRRREHECASLFMPERSAWSSKSFALGFVGTHASEPLDLLGNLSRRAPSEQDTGGESVVDEGLHAGWLVLVSGVCERRTQLWSE